MLPLSDGIRARSFPFARVLLDVGRAGPRGNSVVGAAT